MRIEFRDFLEYNAMKLAEKESKIDKEFGKALEQKRSEHTNYGRLIGYDPALDTAALNRKAAENTIPEHYRINFEKALREARNKLKDDGDNEC